MQMQQIFYNVLTNSSFPSFYYKKQPRFDGFPPDTHVPQHGSLVAAQTEHPVGGEGGGVEGVGPSPPGHDDHQHTLPPRPQLEFVPTSEQLPPARSPSAQIVEGRGSFFVQMYLSTDATGGELGGGVGGFIGARVGGDVGLPVGTDVGLDVGLGVEGGPASMHPLVVSKTADTSLEKPLSVSCSITQKKAPPLQANSPLL